MLTNIRLYLLSTLLAAVFPALGQSLAMKHFDTANGLSNNKINTILRTSDGFLWVGTSSGLCRYDGYTFKLYAPADGQGYGSYIEDLCEDSHGRLWVFGDSRYSVYDPHTDRITVSGDSIAATWGMEGALKLLHVDPEGRYWADIEGHGLWRINADGSGARRVAAPIPPDCTLTDIIDSPRGILVLDNAGHLFVFDPETLETVEQDNLIAEQAGPGHTYVYTARCDREGVAWIYNNEGLRLRDMHTGRWLSDRLPSGGRGELVKTIMSDSHGRIWAGRDHKGLEMVVKSGDGVSFRRMDDSRDGDGVVNTVTAIYEDPGSTLWVGTYKRGLAYHHDAAKKFSLISLPDVNVILPAADGRVWVGTDVAGLMKWNPTDGSATSVPDPAEGSNPAAVTSLLECGPDTLYVGPTPPG